MLQKNSKTVRASVMILSMFLESCSAEIAVRAEHKQCINKVLEYIVALLPHHRYYFAPAWRAFLAELPDSLPKAYTHALILFKNLLFGMVH